MAPAELDERPETNVAAQLGGSDGSDGAGSDKEEDETKFVEWDPTGRFGRVRSPPSEMLPSPSPRTFSSPAPERALLRCFSRYRMVTERAVHDGVAAAMVARTMYIPAS